MAAKHCIALSPAVTLITGFGSDWRDRHRAQAFGTPPGGGPARIFSYPTRNGEAWNAWGPLAWFPRDDSRLAVSVSSRARFPTRVERVSSRFGGATSNPDPKASGAPRPMQPQ